MRALAPEGTTFSAMAVDETSSSNSRMVTVAHAANSTLMQVWHYGSDIYTLLTWTYDEHVVRQAWGRAAEGVPNIPFGAFFCA